MMFFPIFNYSQWCALQSAMSIPNGFATSSILQHLAHCSDFRYESNGIFVLGVGFFSSDNFRLFN